MKTAVETKDWVKKTFVSFKIAKVGYLPNSNRDNTIKALHLGLTRIAYRTNTEKQWSANVPSKSEFEQLMYRNSDGVLFSFKDKTLIEWSKRDDLNTAEIIRL